MSFQSLVYQALFDVPWGPRTARRSFGYLESIRDGGMRFAVLTMSSAQFRNSSLGPQLIEKSSLEVFSKAIHFFLESAPKANIIDESDDDGRKISSHSTLGFTRKLILNCNGDARKKIIDLLVALKSVKYFTKSVTEITVDGSIEDEVISGPVSTDSSSSSYYASIAPHLRGFENLRELIYGDSSEFAIQSLAPVLASLPSLETLALLNVMSSSGGDEDLGIDEGYMFGSWFAQLGSSPRLKNFALDRSNGSFDDAVTFHNEEQFEEGLRGFCRNTNKTLEKFCLVAMPTSISDDTLLRGFFDEADNNNLLLLSTKLASFSLANCPGISGTSLVPLINNHLAQHNNLTELDFSHTSRLTEDDLIGITSTITSLVALTLASSSKINGSFLKKNAKNLGSSLQELEMSNTFFSDETVGEDTFDHGNYSSLQMLRISDSSKLVGGKCLLGFIAPTSCRNKHLVINIAYCKNLDEVVKAQLIKAGVILSKEGEH